MSMLVPDFWAEGRAQSRAGQRQLTVRRFGWSMVGQDDAQRMADERAQAALTRVLAGERLARRDRKVPYNGADGVPIREQVVSRHGDEMITRNSYGALCLNTPRVLIADVDRPEVALRSWWFIWLPLCSLSIALVMGVFWRFWPAPLSCARSASGFLEGLAALGGRAALAVAAIGAALAVLAVIGVLADWVDRRRRRAARDADEQPGGWWESSLHRVRAFAAAHPDWGLRIYRTPAGRRLIVTHRTFSAEDPAVTEFFQAVQADPLYVAMCRHQHCFRARLTGKPWRMGIEEHLKPRPGVWPVAPESVPARDAWLAAYDARARSFAACRFEAALGPPAQPLDVAVVVDLHDSLSQARKPELTLA